MKRPSKISDATWARLRAQVELYHPTPTPVLTQREIESRALKDRAGWDFREMRCTAAGLQACTAEERARMFAHWFNFVMAEYWIPRWRRPDAEKALVPLFERGERANGARVIKALAKQFNHPVMSRDVYLMHRLNPFGDDLPPAAGDA